jgi:hypothetical protein
MRWRASTAEEATSAHWTWPLPGAAEALIARWRWVGTHSDGGAAGWLGNHATETDCVAVPMIRFHHLSMAQNRAYVID